VSVQRRGAGSGWVAVARRTAHGAVPKAQVACRPSRRRNLAPKAECGADGIQYESPRRGLSRLLLLPLPSRLFPIPNPNTLFSSGTSRPRVDIGPGVCARGGWAVYMYIGCGCCGWGCWYPGGGALPYRGGGYAGAYGYVFARTCCGKGRQLHTVAARGRWLGRGRGHRAGAGQGVRLGRRAGARVVVLRGLLLGVGVRRSGHAVAWGVRVVRHLLLYGDGVEWRWPRAGPLDAVGIASGWHGARTGAQAARTVQGRQRRRRWRRHGRGSIVARSGARAIASLALAPVAVVVHGRVT
jgi:hypothetical protein